MPSLPWSWNSALSQEKANGRLSCRRYPASQICDVVVRVRGQEIVQRCPNYSHALKWARLECKSYLISELTIMPPLEAEDEDVPLFLRSPGPQLPD
jgi:hypothetical protein